MMMTSASFICGAIMGSNARLSISTELRSEGGAERFGLRGGAAFLGLGEAVFFQGDGANRDCVVRLRRMGGDRTEAAAAHGAKERAFGGDAGEGGGVVEFGAEIPHLRIVGADFDCD